MTASGTAAPPGPSASGAPAGDPAGRTASRSRRRWIWPIAVAATIAITALVTTALLPRTNRGSLDPRSAEPDGARAVAQILKNQGVSVDVVERSDDAVAGATRATAIVVVRTSLLGPRQLQRLADSSADLILVEPDFVVLRELAPSVTPSGVAADTPALPACADPDASVADKATAGGHLYSRASTAPADVQVTGCYPDSRHPERFSLIRLANGDRRITILGQGQVLQNDTLPVDGNAALALRTLGLRPELRWYLPDPVELAKTARPSISDLLPPWVGWAFWQLVIVTFVVLLWRGRRLGPVVPEPLPVVVRSAETAEGRARLYRTGKARSRAAAVLRTATVRRLASRLGVPSHAEPVDVARLAAEASSTDPARSHRLLLGEPPRDDAALVALAGALDDLERAVAGTKAPGPRYGDAAQNRRQAEAAAGTQDAGQAPGTVTEHRPDPEGGR